MDRFFWRYAAQNQFRHHIGTTYVAVDAANAIAGFATVAASQIAPEATARRQGRRLPAYPVPALRLARLAVDQRWRDQGIGALLIRAVFGLAIRMRDDLGCVGILVDAKPEAVSFYERLGFVRLETVAGELGDRPVPQAMFLEIGQLQRLHPLEPRQ